MEFVDIFNNPIKAIKYFKQLIRSPGSNSDASRLGYTSTEEGESSKSGEQNNNKGKNKKPTCHSCGKLGCTTDVYRRIFFHQSPKQKYRGKY